MSWQPFDHAIGCEEAGEGSYTLYSSYYMEHHLAPSIATPTDTKIDSIYVNIQSKGGPRKSKVKKIVTSNDMKRAKYEKKEDGWDG